MNRAYTEKRLNGIFFDIPTQYKEIIDVCIFSGKHSKPLKYLSYYYSPFLSIHLSLALSVSLCLSLSLSLSISFVLSLSLLEHEIDDLTSELEIANLLRSMKFETLPQSMKLNSCCHHLSHYPHIIL